MTLKNTTQNVTQISSHTYRKGLDRRSLLTSIIMSLGAAACGGGKSNSSPVSQAAESGALPALVEAIDDGLPFGADIVPGQNWNGSSGSGFQGNFPIDPERTTAKPVVRSLQPTNQWFTNTLTIGVWAAANENGSLLNNFGLEKVVVHFEGKTFDILEPTERMFSDVNGVIRRYLGWWVTIGKPAKLNGHAQLFWEAIPRDGSMQRRIVGPHQYSPQEKLHDIEVKIASSQPEVDGASYQSLGAALSYFASNNAQNPKATIVESGQYELGRSSTRYSSGQGYCTIGADVPVTIKNSEYLIGSSRLVRPLYDGLWFKGKEIKFDFRNGSTIYLEDAAVNHHVFEGVSFYDSGGRYDPYLLGQKVCIGIARNGPWLMECDISTIQDAARNALLVRGCDLHDGNSDCASGARLVIRNRIWNWTSDEWRTEIPALSVYYVGSDFGATLELSGGNDATSRLLTARVGGAVVGSFTVIKSEDGYLQNTNYTVQNVANWLNSLDGWGAKVLDNSRRATALSLPKNSGAGFAPIAVGSSPVTLVTMFDQHADLWQILGGVGDNDNVAFVDNICWNNHVQSLFAGSSASITDCMVINNVFDLDENSFEFGPLASQLFDRHSHVVVAHNSWTNQNLILRADKGYSTDKYCLIANNVVPTISWSGMAGGNVQIRDNHLFTVGSSPALAAGTTVGGTKNSLFASATSGDFAPRGELLSNLKMPSLELDRTGARRAVPSAVGADCV